MYAKFNDMEDILDIIKNNLKISQKPVKGPSYLLPDGTYLDIFNSNMKTHGSVEEWLYENNYIDDYSITPALIQLGAIRLNDGSNFGGESLIELPEEITHDQIYALEDYLEYLESVKDWVDATDRNQDLYSFTFRDDSINKIIGKIKSLYKGIKESKEENPLKKMSQYNKRHQKGWGWFCYPSKEVSVKQDAGNVPYNNSVFNNGMISSNGNFSVGQSLGECNLKPTRPRKADSYNVSFDKTPGRENLVKEKLIQSDSDEAFKKNV